MKHIRIFILAVAVMSCSVGNAVADDLVLSAPNINDKLDRMIEKKMNSLINKMHDDRVYSRVVEQMEDEVNDLQRVMKEKLEVDFS